MQNNVLSVIQTVQISKDFRTTMDKICDVQNWKNIALQFQNSELILKGEQGTLTRMTTIHNGMSFDRFTLRYIEKTAMRFEHLNVKFPVKRHFGIWKFNCIGKDLTEVTLEHKYVACFGIVGYFLGKVFLSPFFFKIPTRNMLNQMKTSIENQ